MLRSSVSLYYSSEHNNEVLKQTISYYYIQCQEYGRYRDSKQTTWVDAWCS